jgi:hypothetical protein
VGDALALGAGGGLDHQGHGDLAAGLEPRLGRVVDQGIEPQHQEIHVGDRDQGAQARRRRPDAEPDHRRLGHRRVTHPNGTELRLQADELLVRAAEGADVLAQEDDPGVAGHLLAQRPRDGLAEEELGRGRRRRGFRRHR